MFTISTEIVADLGLELTEEIPEKNRPLASFFPP